MLGKYQKVDEEGRLRGEVVITVSLKYAFYYRVKNIAKYTFDK